MLSILKALRTKRNYVKMRGRDRRKKRQLAL